MPGKKNRIVVAMSGGVDSSTAAAILKNEGYEVIGLTMHLWGEILDGKEVFSRCCSPEDIRDARRAADQIGIPHYVVNLREAFEKEIIHYFVEEYLNGRTPNPCIRCNDRIKFGLLLRKAAELDAAALATGHYARIEMDPAGKRILLRGRDRHKDQSYFLFLLTQERMDQIIFPLGEKSKGEVRELAAQLGLNLAWKNESQEICFIPKGDYRPFVQGRMKDGQGKPGEVVNRQGKVLGLHEGLYSYTVGQRHGLGIAGSHSYYVLALDPGKNRVVVGSKEELGTRGLVAGGVNWISSLHLGGGMEALVQIRYRHPAAPAVFSPLQEGKVKVAFKTPQKSVTPGQAAVFYRGDEVLGGGWIEKTF